MKKTLIVITLALNSMITSISFAGETDSILPFRLSGYEMSSSNNILNDFSLNLSYGVQIPLFISTPNYDDIYITENILQIPDHLKKGFSLVPRKQSVYSLSLFSYITEEKIQKKHYLKTALEITVSNIVLWAFDRYILDESWAYISWDTIAWNFERGPAWDIDSFSTNHFAHPYHGAVHHSIARRNGFNFFESTIWAFVGSFMWEFILEARGLHDNPPSANDLILNTLGGATFGETLFRIADLVIDESSSGVERALRESFAILINPAFVLRVFSGKSFKIGSPPEIHNFSLNLPFGVYRSSTNKLNFTIATNLEYKDYMKEDITQIKPYDWFTFECRIGFQDNSIRDKEIFTTGIIAGKKIKNGLVGLFGIYDYIDTHTVDKLSAVGVGPGYVTSTDSDSGLFFSSSGVLSLILGASTPSLEPEDYHFGKKHNTPYYFGPGMLGRLRVEVGKGGIGSIYTGYSQYWIHSIYTHANEFQSILSLEIKYDLSKKSQISLGYDYFLRSATLQEQHFSGKKNTARALYTLKF